MCSEELNILTQAHSLINILAIDLYFPIPICTEIYAYFSIDIKVETELALTVSNLYSCNEGESCLQLDSRDSYTC